MDWNPTPPDKNMGLWREVYLTTSGPVAVRYPQVVTHFDAQIDHVPDAQPPRQVLGRFDGEAAAGVGIFRIVRVGVDMLEYHTQNVWELPCDGWDKGPGTEEVKILRRVQ